MASGKVEEGRTSISVPKRIISRLKRMGDECLIPAPELARMAIETLLKEYEAKGFIVLGKNKPTRK